MDYIKTLIWKPTLDEQRRSCNALLRTDLRGIDRSISNQIAAENKAKAIIQAAHRRSVLFSAPTGSTGPRNSIAAEAARKEMRTMAKELVHLRRHTARLHTCKAQLSSVQMQVNEAFAARKIDSSLRSSTQVMHAVNGMVSMPELLRSAQVLSAKLVEAGVIDEMISDTLDMLDPVGEDGDLLGEGEETEDEIQKVLRDVLKLPPDGKVETGPVVEHEDELEFPELPPPRQSVPERDLEPETGPGVDDTREMIAAMRGRLEALKE